MYHTDRILIELFSKEIHSALHRYCGIDERLSEILSHNFAFERLFHWTIGKIIKFRQRLSDLRSDWQGYFLSPIFRFDEEADSLWTGIRTRYDFAVERYSSYLNWKYCDQPHVEYHCFYIKESAIIQGILVVRHGTSPESPIGVICECLLREPSKEKYGCILNKAVDYLKEMGAAGIWMATAEPEFEAAAHEQGFLRLKREPMMLHFEDRQHALDPNMQKALIGIGDHDWDQYPKLRQPYLRQFLGLAFGS
jgi:hypothetical protein